MTGARQLLLDAEAEYAGAIFSPCEAYRYRLWRRWHQTDPYLLFVLLNPSTADAEKDDPTVRRCSRRARRLGFGGVEVVNIYALRSTDPRALRGHPNPVGPSNDAAIASAARAAGGIIVAWGDQTPRLGQAFADRTAAVMDILGRSTVKVWCLGTTAAGFPRHPLYLPNDVQLKAYG